MTRAQTLAIMASILSNHKDHEHCGVFPYACELLEEAEKMVEKTGEVPPWRVQPIQVQDKEVGW